jgi:mRNA interferase HigB
MPADCVHNVYMRVISLKRLRKFWARHSDAEMPLVEWYNVARHAKWNSIQDVRRTYRSADAVKADSGATMTVFNIGGNKYRLITSVWYKGQQVYIKRILTHAEYSKGNWKKQL